MDEIRGLLCHTANLKEEVVKGIIQRSEFKPKLSQHAQCVALICVKSQPVVLNHEGTRKRRERVRLFITLSANMVRQGWVMEERWMLNLRRVLTKGRTHFLRNSLLV